MRTLEQEKQLDQLSDQIALVKKKSGYNDDQALTALLICTLDDIDTALDSIDTNLESISRDGC